MLMIFLGALTRLEQTTSCTVKFCPYEMCSDNAVMIAIAALYILDSKGGNFEYSKVTNYANVDDKTTLDYFTTYSTYHNDAC